jgi:hypothetical protein
MVDLEYQRPGRELGVRLGELRTAHEEQTFLLRSHGLVVVAPSVERAIALTLDAEARCHAAAPSGEPFDAVWARHAERAPFSLGALRAKPLPPRKRWRPLFPDAVVYALHLQVDSLEEPALVALFGELGSSFVACAPSGERLLIARDDEALSQAAEVAAAHDFVSDRLGDSGVALPEGEDRAIRALPSERYRMRGA